MIEEIERILIKTGSYSHANGSLNVTAIAKATGIPQPTLKHIFDGTTKNPRIDLLEKLCELGRVKYGDLHNNAVLKTDNDVLTMHERRVLAIFRTLNTKEQRLAIKLISVIG
jgi:DNA-binding Xre family transcriptional regulator